MINEPLMFCTHAHAATTSGTIGAGGLSVGDISGIVIGILGLLVAIVIPVGIALVTYQVKKGSKTNGESQDN